MEKEEILARSRAENQNKDIYELDIIRKAQRIGSLIGISVAFVLMVLEAVFSDSEVNYGYFLIILSGCTGLWIYKATKLKKKHEIFFSALWSIMFLYTAVMYILRLIG